MAQKQRKTYAILEVGTSMDNGHPAMIRQDLSDLNHILFVSESDYPDMMDVFLLDAEDEPIAVHPAKLIAFINKYNLLLRKSTYNDICVEFIQNQYNDHISFTFEGINEWLDAVDHNMDKFPGAVDFPMEAELIKATSEVY